MVRKFEFLIHINIFLTYMEKMNLEFYNAKKNSKTNQNIREFSKNFFEKYFNQLFYMLIAIKHVFF